ASAVPCSSSRRKPAAGRSGIPGSPTSSFAAGRPSPACPIAPITRAWPTSRRTCAGIDGSSEADRSTRLPEAIIERIAGTAHGADRIGVVAAVVRFAQPADMNVHGAFTDVHLDAPHTAAQLFPRGHAAPPLH